MSKLSKLSVILCQDLIDKFFNQKSRKARSIEVNTFNKLRKKQDNKGVAIAAPKKKGVNGAK